MSNVVPYTTSFANKGFSFDNINHFDQTIWGWNFYHRPPMGTILAVSDDIWETEGVCTPSSPSPSSGSTCTPGSGCN
jgi:hypothetical protein